MAQETAGVPRRILRRVRQLMAGSGTGEERLNEFVRILAGELVAEVCSVYIMRAGEVLELFATEGLNPNAVHRTRLRVGEGLVGDIAAHARPLNLSDAQSHPQFAYRPETGEEAYQSLVGVPIVRGGRVRGVLVVQNRTQRQYTEDEVEALEIVAMVVAEMVAGGNLVNPAETVSPQGNAILPSRLQGVRINAGMGMGEAVLHQPRVSIPQMFAEDTNAELDRLAVAVNAMRSAIDDLFKATDLADRGEHRDVLEAYRMFAEDTGWLRRIREAIRGGLSVEAAVQKVEDDTRARMSQIADPYLRERLSDFEDVSNRLMRHLTEQRRTHVQRHLPENVVLLAHSMGPAELLDYERSGVRALVLEEATPNAHVAIIARALGIPVVGQVKDLLSRIDPNDPVIVDGDNGVVYVRPGEDIQLSVAEGLRYREEQRALYSANRNEPAMTRDGVEISLNLNAGLLIDLKYLDEVGADGVGLYRTEIPFMVRSQFPDVAAQESFYQQVLSLAGDRTVMFRTLDIGGDKRLPYFSGGVEDENPAMGWRAIRVGLDRPFLLRQQIRALMRASAGRDLDIMFPMVAEVAEFQRARSLVELEEERERRSGREMPTRIRVGSMIEVPGLLWQLPALLREADFLSVGTNDLFQFMFASDRGNPQLADRYDVLAPGPLQLLRWLIEQCHEADRPISICGEMAGRPLEAMALIGLGFRTLSMPPDTLGAVKVMTRSLNVGPLEVYLDSLRDAPDHSLREKLRAFALDHGVALDGA